MASPRPRLPGRGIDWDFFVDDYDRIRDKIEAVFPQLFADFNKRIRHPGGLHLTIHRASEFGTRLRDAQIFLVFDGLNEDPAAAVANKVLRLATLRSHDQYNTTIYSLDDRYRGVFDGRSGCFHA